MSLLRRNRSPARPRGLGFLLAGTLLALVAESAAAEEITVYTTLLPNQLAPYTQSFRQAHPDISIKWMRDSTGVIAARLLSEGSRSPADVVFSMASENIIQAGSADLLLPYKPAGYDEIDRKFKDKNDPPLWSGIFAYMAAVCFNTVEAKKRGIPTPKKWSDLLDPRFKGQITMPDPASSGTGFISVSGWLQKFGEGPGWDFMEKLHPNIAIYTHSGNKPCNSASNGEFVAGISYSSEGVLDKGRGAPIDVIFPEEGVGWALSTVAILKSSKKQDAAKKFADWAVSPAANKVYSEFWEVIARPAQRQQSSSTAVDPSTLLTDNDHYWVASDRDRILKEWQSRFAGKSDPKR
jgi:iron(III) transport system substrate-binding protein